MGFVIGRSGSEANSGRPAPAEAGHAIVELAIVLPLLLLVSLLGLELSRSLKHAELAATLSREAASVAYRDKLNSSKTLYLPGTSYPVDNGLAIGAVSDAPDSFSPNGDGYYELTRIAFTLSGAAQVTVRIYDAVGATSSSRDPVPLEAPATPENILKAIHELHRNPGR